MEDAHVDFRRFDLKPEAQAVTKSHSAWMVRNRDATAMVVVQGHCDERGTSACNPVLERRRGNSAARSIIDQEVDARRTLEISYGFERPADPRQDEEAWEKNRRVHFTVTDKKEAYQ